MFALKLRINDEPPIIAGAEDLGVLSAIVNLGGALGAQAHRSRPDAVTVFHCHLGGLTSRGPAALDEHLHWLQHWDLKVGDRVTIEIVETDEADAAVGCSPAKPRHPHPG